MVKNKGRGFASMSPKKRSEVAGKGGKTTQKKGAAHKFTHEEAVAAGRLGGKISKRKFPK